MKHRVFGQKLSRDINARHALLVNLASSLFTVGKITTTLSKAKFARSYVEKLITSAKKDGLSGRRFIASSLTKQAFLKLTREIAPGFAKRDGGYTRIVKLGQRRGDAAPLARLELLPVPKIAEEKKKKPKKIKEPKVTKKEVVKNGKGKTK